MRPEEIIEKKLADGVVALGGQCYKLVEDGKRGFPDRTVVMAGLVEFIELKAHGGKLSRQQEAKIEEIKDAGGRAFVLTGIKNVEQYLEKLKLTINPPDMT